MVIFLPTLSLKVFTRATVGSPGSTGRSLICDSINLEHPGQWISLDP